MIPTLIIEDEKPAAKALRAMSVACGLDIVGICHSVQEIVDWFATHTTPQLILADIQLGDGLSFDAFEQVKPQSFIIFITAFDHYSLRAFQLNSIDYLLKPIQTKDLQKAINKFKKFQEPIPYFQALKTILQSQKSYKERFVVNVGAQLKIVEAQNIKAFIVENKINYMILNENRYAQELSLDELENVLNPKRFFRVNRQNIVAIDAIEKIVSYTNSRLKLKIKNISNEIIVSRERVKFFRQWLEN